MDIERTARVGIPEIVVRTTADTVEIEVPVGIVEETAERRIEAIPGPIIENADTVVEIKGITVGVEIMIDSRAQIEIGKNLKAHTEEETTEKDPTAGIETRINRIDTEVSLETQVDQQIEHIETQIERVEEIVLQTNLQIEKQTIGIEQAEHQTEEEIDKVQKNRKGQSQEIEKIDKEMKAVIAHQACSAENV